MVELVETIFGLLQIISILVYAAIVIHFFAFPTTGERLKFLAVVAGFIIIELVSRGLFSSWFFNPQWGFAFTQLVFIAFMALLNRPMLIHKYAVVVLFVVFVLAMQLNFFFSWLVAACVYVIIVYGFLYSALQFVLGNPLPRFES